MITEGFLIFLAIMLFLVVIGIGSSSIDVSSFFV